MTTPNFESLKILVKETTLVVTIDRPDALNALNASVLKSLGSLLSWLEEAGNLKAFRTMVITGSGEKAFVAGADITEFLKLNTNAALELAKNGQNLFTRLERLPIPVIAAVNGFALGGGLELALAADFIYASENAKFGLPECTLGLMPGYGGTIRLPRRVGPARALELTFSGQMISAEEALKMGLVNRVVAKGEVVKAAVETAELFATRAPLALAGIKKSIHLGPSQSPEKAFETEAKMFGELFASEDQKEGVGAFMEKRKSSFVGR